MTNRPRRRRRRGDVMRLWDRNVIRQQSLGLTPENLQDLRERQLQRTEELEKQKYIKQAAAILCLKNLGVLPTTRRKSLIGGNTNRWDLPSSKRDAEEQGINHYFTGLPCLHGHIAARNIFFGCLICSRIRAPKYRFRYKNSSNASKRRTQLRLSAAMMALKNLGIKI